MSAGNEVWGGERAENLLLVNLKFVMSCKTLVRTCQGGENGFPLSVSRSLSLTHTHTHTPSIGLVASLKTRRDRNTAKTKREKKMTKKKEEKKKKKKEEERRRKK